MAKNKNYMDVLSVASNMRAEIKRLGLGPPEMGDIEGGQLILLYDKTVTDAELIGCSRSLFLSKHYTQAVDQAYKLIVNLVKKKSSIKSDGPDLIRKAFRLSGGDLLITDCSTESKKNEHEGYTHILAGSIQGIRNPRAHEHELKDHPEMALELLILANHLVKVVKSAKKI